MISTPEFEILMALYDYEEGETVPTKIGELRSVLQKPNQSSVTYWIRSLLNKGLIMNKGSFYKLTTNGEAVLSALDPVWSDIQFGIWQDGYELTGSHYHKIKKHESKTAKEDPKGV